MLEVFHTGKISFFSDYNYNYDLSINSFARDIIVVRDYLVDNQNGKFYGPYAHKLGAFSAITLMDNLIENFKDYPDLQSMTENVQSKEGFINLLKSYDAK